MQGDEGGGQTSCLRPPKATRQTGRYHAPGFDPIRDTSREKKKQKTES
jgi:hypothetical protein